MNGVIRDGGIRRIGFFTLLLLSAVSLKANPISEAPPNQLGTIIPVTLAILTEAVCISLLLIHKRTPHLFILWLMGMHFLTYPFFLGLLWFTGGFLYPPFAIVLGEGSVVLIEGTFIYLLCHFLPSVNIAFPVPSFLKCLFASLVGNVCSIVAFPLMMILYGLIVSPIEASNFR